MSTSSYTSVNTDFGSEKLNGEKVIRVSLLGESKSITTSLIWPWRISLRNYLNLELKSRQTAANPIGPDNHKESARSATNY